MIRIEANGKALRWLLMIAAAAALYWTATLPTYALEGETSAHDPSRITKCNGKYFYYCTGDFIPSRSSTDLIHWVDGPNVMKSIPQWAHGLVPGNTGTSVWAPDVLFFDHLYHLYYAFSSFGTPVSVIGMMTSPTLDPSQRGYGWTDQGPIIVSNDKTGYNAIDPCPVFDGSGKLWLAFGSWDNYGIGMVQLNAKTGKRVSPNSPVYHLAGTAMEAPYILAHGGYFFLFENIGFCCRGVDSTYQVMIGRSRSITGPYVDKSGKDLLNGGGSSFMASDGNCVGPGQVGYFRKSDGTEYLSYHYYNAAANGAPTFALMRLGWGKDGWPITSQSSSQAAPSKVKMRRPS